VLHGVNLQGEEHLIVVVVNEMAFCVHEDACEETAVLPEVAKRCN
jgi:hypothetical protein